MDNLSFLLCRGNLYTEWRITMYKYEEFSDPIQRPRYTGVPTFLRAPYEEEWDNVDIGLVGVPFDGGVTNRPGARQRGRAGRSAREKIS